MTLTTLFPWFMVGALALLVLSVVVLVWINQSADVYLQVAAAMVVGMLTFLVTFIPTLKPAAHYAEFVTFIVEDTTNNRQPVYVTQRGMALDIFGIASQVVGVIANRPQNPPPPRISESDVPDLYLELLQYYVVRTLRDEQRPGVGVAVTTAARGVESRAFLNTPAKLTEPVDLKGDAALRTLSTNRFAQGEIERELWKTMGLQLPYGSELKLEKSAEGRLWRSVVIRRPGYLNVVITVSETLGSGAKPAGLSLPAEAMSHCRTHYYLVTIKVDFPRLTAGSRWTPENREWVEWLSNMLRSQLSSPPTT